MSKPSMNSDDLRVAVAAIRSEAHRSGLFISAPIAVSIADSLAAVGFSREDDAYEERK